nr:ABC transporter substrate-binding protein [Enterovibrio nigricans]
MKGNIQTRKRTLLAASIAALLASPAFAAQFNEAPDLKALVAEGKLPSVEQRLPSDPLVVTPFEAVGQYGGTMNLVGLWGDNGHRMRILGNNNLFSFNHTYTDVEPSLATGYESNAEATEYTIFLRKDMKWSDGSDFTADDIVYYVNDVLGDPNHAGNRPLYFKDYSSAKAEAVDKHAVKISLTEPNGLFIRQLAGVDGSNIAAFNKATVLNSNLSSTQT